MEITNHETIEEAETQFTTDSQLLSELGERLISSEYIALSELVKNSYDADATQVNIWVVEKGEERFLYLKDNGNGMSKEQFLSDWMKVGTRAKLKNKRSASYSRNITGSKGIGRFASRFLGGTLTLETTAYDDTNKEYRQISAYFPWKDIREGDLSSFKVRYKISGNLQETDKGTTLIIGDLKFMWSEDDLKDITRQLVDIVSPPLPNAIRKRLRGLRDPGLTLLFGPPERGEKVEQAMEELLEKFQAMMNIYVDDDMVRYTCNYKGKKKSVEQFHKLSEGNKVGYLFAQIRYYPRRKDVFKNFKNIDGRSASRYLKNNGGVRVFDRGFRVLPYGNLDDDWLGISKDKARNSREWGSPITKKLFPESSLSKEEALNPVLSIPANHQLLGVVYVESEPYENQNSLSVHEDQLKPAMDREGFVENEAFHQLIAIIRAGVDLIGKIDKEESLEEKKERAKKEGLETTSKINEAIEYVRARDDIQQDTKEKIITSYEQIKDVTERAILTQKDIVSSMEYVSLLGVLGGFMTHETNNVRRSIDEALVALRQISQENAQADVTKIIMTVEKANEQIKNQIEYIRLFMHQARNRKQKPFMVRPQITKTMAVLKEYLEERKIRVEIEADANLVSPPIPVVVFSGVLMNLLTNAAKALLLSNSKDRKMLIRSINEGKSFKLLVMDNGVGIPPSARDFIFEPFFTTTDELEGPFGTGMGLGLYIVKRSVESEGGKVKLVDPVHGFSTCFEVSYEKR